MYLKQVQRCIKCNRLYTHEEKTCTVCETKLKCFEFDHVRKYYALKVTDDRVSVRDPQG